MAGRIAYLGNISPQGLVLDLDAGIKGSYPGSGTTWSDISNNGNNGTLTNGPLFTGSDYGAIVFDGVDDTINFGNVLNIGLSDWTVSAWINSTIAHFGRVVAKNNSSADGWFIGVENNEKFVIGINGTYGFSSTYNYSTAGWVHLVGVWNRTGFATLYANSVFLGNIVNISSQSSTNLQTSFNLRISSRDSGGGFFNGNISNVQVYNRALSAAEVTQNFNAYRSRYGI